jgi:NAD(P)-dependent dehydrogenase (short-subunit alcohol dehydrogenase family)
MGVAGIPRYIMEPKSAPLAEPRLIPLKGLFLITEDRLAVAPHVASALEQRGAVPAILPEKILGDGQRLDREIARLRQRYGSVAGIVHLASLVPWLNPASLSEWRTYTACHVKSLCQMVRHCCQDESPSQQSHLRYVLWASLLGGYFGRRGNPIQGLATGGAGNGFLKTLAVEQPEIQVKAVDLDASLSPQAMAECLVQEMLLPQGRIEVGYPQGQRTIFQTVPAPIPESRLEQCQPEQDWVVLVTGGARGITSEVVMELAGIGLTLIIMGRSPYPEEETPATKNIANIAVLRRVFLDKAHSERGSKTPVEIERQIERLLRQRAIRDNLRRFQQVGAKLEYVSVDVRNSSEFGAAIDEIYARYGHLDAVIHGAGIIEDKLIVDKVPDSFDRVFDTKVDSTFILSQHLQPDSLKLLALFSSVAGRYGNRGQSDYAAANEVVNRMAWQLDCLWPTTRIVAINWGPWDTTGMASEEVKRQFKERGVIPIGLEEGCQFFTREWRYGQKGETEIMAGVGPWEAYEQEMAKRRVGTEKAGTAPRENFTAPISAVPTSLMFLDAGQIQLQPNSTVTLEHTFSLENDPYLGDHCLDGKPVLPAAGALEWLAELVQVAWPDWMVAAVEDLRVLRGLVIEPDRGKSVQLKALPSTHADAESLKVTAEILDPLSNLPFYRAIIRLQLELNESPKLWVAPLKGGQSLNPSQAYQQYLFHGKCFQLLSAIPQLTQQGIDARIRASQPLEWFSTRSSLPRPSVSWLFDPAIIDLAPQLAIIWTRVQHAMTVLPSRFGVVTRYRLPALSTPSQVAFRVTDAQQYNLTYEAIFFDEENNVHFYLQDFQGTGSSQLNRLASQ